MDSESDDEDCFSSAAEVCNSMPYELSYSAPAGWDKLWVFWSQQDNELQSRCPGFDDPISRNVPIKEKIKVFLQLLDCSYLSTSLIQFWAPVRTAGKIYLTPTYQPFALHYLHKGLCSYRTHCLENILILDELGGEEHNLGPPGRVFRCEFPESCSDISYYLNVEYPPRDRALKLGVKGCAALPLFESAGQHCIGVLEIVSIEDFTYDEWFYVLDDYLTELGLTCRMDQLMKYGTDQCILAVDMLYGNPEACTKALAVMDCIFRRRKLPFARMWVALSNTGHMVRLYELPEAELWQFEQLRMKKGQGVVGKAFSSRGACFCQDVSKLSISVYPLVPFARKLGLSGCFAVCLRLTDQVDHFYILEFFLPRSEIEFGDARNLVSMLVAELQEEIGESENSPIQKLEERLSVEVIKISSDHDEIDSFAICPTQSSHAVSRHSDHDEVQNVGMIYTARSRPSLSDHRGSNTYEDSLHPANENTDARSVQDGSSITVKAEYGEHIWKFQLSPSAKKIDLEQEVATRLKSRVGNFYIKYLDEENELISVACDEDLKLCIDACRSQGKTTIRMLVYLAD